jgi:hypothetical protein
MAYLIFSADPIQRVGRRLSLTAIIVLVHKAGYFEVPPSRGVAANGTGTMAHGPLQEQQKTMPCNNATQDMHGHHPRISQMILLKYCECMSNRTRLNAKV